MPNASDRYQARKEAERSAKKKQPKKTPVDVMKKASEANQRNKPPVNPSPAKAAPTPKPKAAAPAKKQPEKKQSFGEAFAANRKAGKSTFTWNGKLYTTQTKEEAAKKAKPKQEAKKPTEKPKKTTSKNRAKKGKPDTRFMY